MSYFSKNKENEHKLENFNYLAQVPQKVNFCEKRNWNIYKLQFFIVLI